MSSSNSSKWPSAVEGASATTAAEDSQPSSALGFYRRSFPPALQTPFMRKDASTSTSEPQSDSSVAAPSTSSNSQPAALKPKRKRITPSQLEVLVDTFQASDTPMYDVRERLASQLDMTNREVQVWFQNRRAKMARIRSQATSTSAEATAQLPGSHPTTEFGMDQSGLSSSSNSGLPGDSPDQVYREQAMDVEEMLESAESSSVISFSRDTLYQTYTIGRYASVPSERLLGSEAELSGRPPPSSKNSQTLSWLSSMRTSTDGGSNSSQYSGFSQPSSYDTPVTTPSSQEHPNSRTYFQHPQQQQKFCGPSTSSHGSSRDAFFSGPAPVLPSPSTNFLKLVSPSQSNKPELPLPSGAGASSRTQQQPLPPVYPSPQTEMHTRPSSRQTNTFRSWHPNWANPVISLGPSTYIPGSRRTTGTSELELYQQETARKA